MKIPDRNSGCKKIGPERIGSFREEFNFRGTYTFIRTTAYFLAKWPSTFIFIENIWSLTKYIVPQTQTER